MKAAYLASLMETSDYQTVFSDMPGMEDVKCFVSRSRWPTGFAECIMSSNDRVAYRFVVIDNSRSMLKQDGHRLAVDRYGVHR